MPRALKSAEIKLPELPDDLPNLTPQQFAFVVGVTSGGLSTIEAYRRAYPNDTSSGGGIYVNAWRLARNTKVAQWIEAARRELLFGAMRSREQHITRLNQLQDLSTAAGNYGAAVKSEELIGRVEGHYLERVKVEGGEADLNQLLKTIEDLLGPEQAYRAAKKLGFAEYQPVVVDNEG